MAQSSSAFHSWHVAWQMWLTQQIFSLESMRDSSSTLTLAKLHILVLTSFIKSIKLLQNLMKLLLQNLMKLLQNHDML